MTNTPNYGIIHALKIEPNYFGDIIDGKKAFEIRENDRNFKVGDYLALNELDDSRTGYSGRSVLTRITYIVDDERFCKKGFVVMGFSVCEAKERAEEWMLLQSVDA